MESNSNKYIQLIGGFIAIVFGVLQGIDWLFKKYEINSFYFNIILIVLLLTFLISIFIYFSKRKKTNSKNKKFGKTFKTRLVVGIISSGLVLLIFTYFFKKINTNQNLVNEIIPELIEVFDKGDISESFRISRELLEEYPNNEIIKNYYNKSSRYVKLKTDKQGIDVSIMYPGDSIFKYIGKTPIDSFLVPNNYQYHKLKFVYNNNEFIERSRNNHNYRFPESTINIPEGHKPFLGVTPRRMWLQGIDFENINIESFSIAVNEVSNKDFQDFVDAGGYENPVYWDFPFKVGDKTYDFNSSVKMFTDRYGRPGPSNWAYGQFPTGLDNYPVTGISWFEARAYAKFSNLSLPNVYQWLLASGNPEDLGNVNQYVTRNSNYDSTQLREVTNESGSFNGLNNIGGNVKEWTLNPNGYSQEKFSIMGGAFNEASYTFNNYYSLSPFDRSIGNGFRLSKNLTNGESNLDDEIIPNFKRNFYNIENVSDEVFEVYKSQFSYENMPLNSMTKNIEKFQDGYTAQRFEMNTTYESDEKLFGFILYSNKFKDKYDPIIIYPTAGSIGTNSHNNLLNQTFNRFKYLIDEGYAIIHPVYHNTYSREKTHNTFWPNDSEKYKNTIVKIGQDYKRSIDYIESRNDFNFENLSYFGYSWGSTTSNYLLAIDDRIKAAVLCVGGLMMQKSKKEVEAHYYIRRIKTPILHIVGKEDGIFGFEESYKPWKELIGTPKNKLKLIELENVGHGLPWDTIRKHHSNWIKANTLN